MRVYKDVSDEWLLERYKHDYGIILDSSVFALLSHHSFVGPPW